MAGEMAGHRAATSDIVAGDEMVELVWNCTPGRAERFEEMWRPMVEAALDYGAKWYAFFRAQNDQWIFKQLMVFEQKLDFERYWYSEELAEARARAAGLYELPILPEWHYPVVQGGWPRETVER
jgi:hypothetical protein